MGENDFASLWKVDPARCIESRHAEGLCVEELDRPVLVLDALHGWRAKERWSSKESLHAHYGELNVRVWRTKCYSGSLFSKRRNLARRMPLAEYLLSGDSCEEGAPYVFEDEFSGPRQELLEDFSVPDCFANDIFHDVPALRKAMPQFRWFLCGLRGSGSAIHVDPRGTAAWNALLAGAKRWWFFPPNQSQSFAETIGADSVGFQPQPPLQWWRERVKQDDGRRMEQLGMLEVVQLPGETVFVPQGWWHQVLNLDFTTSATQNFVLPKMLPAAFAEWRRAWPNLLTVYRHARRPEGVSWPEPDEEQNI